MKKLSIFLVLIAVALTATAIGLAASTTIVVTEDDVTRQAENTPPTDNWVLYTRAGTPPTAGAFVVGPETPPAGVGSLKTQTTTGAEKVFLFNYDHVGTRLADVTALGYSTYRDEASTTGDTGQQQAPAINVQVDFNGDAAGGFTTLVYEPVYNGTVVEGEWQTWNALGGKWWSTRPINGVCAFDCFVPWSYIVANNPDAVITGGFGINQGSGNGGLFAASDALTIGYDGDTFTYDFEPYRVAAAKEQCKAGGWQTYKRADGSSFKNQGDCVQYTNNGK